MPEPISIVTNELPPEFNHQGSESLTSITRSSVDVSAETSKEESKAKEDSEDGHSAKKTSADDDGKKLDKSILCHRINNDVTDNHEASPLKKVDDMLSTITNKILPPEFNDRPSEGLTPMTRTPGDDSTVTSKEDSKAKEDSEDGQSAEKTAADDDGELSDKGSLGDGINVVTDKHEDEASTVTKVDGELSDKSSLGDGINVVTDKHEDEASTVTKVDDTSRANPQVNPHNTNYQVNDQGSKSLIPMSGDSKAKEDSEDVQSAKKTSADDDIELLGKVNLDHGVGDATDKIEEPPGKKIDDISRVYQNPNSEVNPQNNQVNDQGSKSSITMTRFSGDASSVTSKGHSKAKADSEDGQSVKKTPADNDSELLDEGNLDHGVGDATDKIEEPPGKKIDDISRVYQNSNSEVNPQNRNYQVNYLMQVIQAMQNEMCVMKNEIKQLKASRGQSQDAAIGFHVQKENSNAITPVEYAQVKNRVSKEVVAEVPDRSDNGNNMKPATKKDTGDEIHVEWDSDSFTGAEINCQMMGSTEVNCSAEREEEAHEERYSKLNISRGNQGELKSTEECQAEAIHGNKRVKNVEITEVILKKTNTSVLGSLKDDTSYGVQAKFDGASEESNDSTNKTDTELFENGITLSSSTAEDADSVSQLDRFGFFSGIASVNDDSDISSFGDNKEGGSLFYHIDTHESSEGDAITNLHKAKKCSHTSQQNIRPRGKNIIHKAQSNISTTTDNLLSGYTRPGTRELAKMLLFKRWTQKPHTYPTRRKIHWVSPEFHLEFVSLDEAVRFDEICSDGTEADKIAAYLQKITQEGTKARYVVGGKHALQNAMSKTNIGCSSNLPDQDLPSKGNNDDECFVCGDGGDLVCCDFCSKSYHAKCHIPCLQLGDQLSDEKCKCCKCSKIHSINPQQQRRATTDNLLSGYTRPGSRELVKTLSSKRWKPIPSITSKKRATHWLSPELHLEFRSLDKAVQFNEICCGSEADKCAAYIQKFSQEGGRTYVVGGMHALQNAISKENNGANSSLQSNSNLPNKEQELPSEGKNDDGIFVCEDGGDKKNIQQRHDRLAAHGWTFEHNRSKNRELLKISPIYKLQFVKLGAAENFQELRDECQGDECKAVEAFIKMMNQKGITITPLLVGGISSLRTVLKNKMTMQKQVCTGAKPVSHVSDKFQNRAKTSLANLSDGWEAVDYKSKATKELHFLSPLYRVHFKSYKGAKLFDNVLLNSTDQPSAIKTFIKKYSNFRGMILNYAHTMSLATDARKRTSLSLTTKAEQQMQKQGGKKKSIPSTKAGFRGGCKRTSSSESADWGDTPRKRKRTDFSGSLHNAISKKNICQSSKSSNTKLGDQMGSTHTRNSLASEGWIFKREKSRLLKISPIRKLQFYSLEAAKDFEENRLESQGDEYRAAKLFEKHIRKIKPGIWFGSLLKGGLKSLYSDSSADHKKKVKTTFDRRKSLASKGWSFKPYKTSILAISPKRNLPFFTLVAAEQFQEDRRKCQGNEYKAAKLFIKRMQNQRTPIGNVLLGGLGKLSGDCNTSSNETSHLSTKAKPQSKRKSCSSSTDSQIQKRQKVDSSLADKRCASRFSKRICERRQVKSESDSIDMPNPSLTSKGSSTDKARHIEDGYWEVEKVLKVRLLSGEMECLVRWKGYTRDDDSWLPAENLDEKSFKEACELLSIVGYKQILTELLSGLVDALKKNDDDEKIFHTLNDVIDLPDYSEVITQPICLSTIQDNVTNCQYETLDEFKQDVDLMFSNCIKFNNEGPDQSNLYRTEAKRQRRKFGDLFKDALHQLQKRMDVAMKVDRS